MDFDSVTLGPDDFLILRPRTDMPIDHLHTLAKSIPEAIRGRVLIVDRDGFDVLHFHPIGAS